jgi:hypothetical protein
MDARTAGRVRPAFLVWNLVQRFLAAFLAVFLAGAFLAVALLAGAFLATVFFAGDFLATVLLAVVLLAGAFLAVVFLAGDFLATVFFAGDFLAAFLAVVFFAVAFFAVLFFAADAVVVFLAGAADFAAATAEAGTFFAPDTTAFRSAPARNLGTAVFLARVRSPVRGLRTIRAGRTAFSNAPKPVIATFSPLATSRVIVSSTDSRAWCAAFLLPSKWLDRASMS